MSSTPRARPRPTGVPRSRARSTARGGPRAAPPGPLAPRTRTKDSPQKNAARRQTVQYPIKTLPIINKCRFSISITQKCFSIHILKFRDIPIWLFWSFKICAQHCYTTFLYSPVNEHSQKCKNYPAQC